MISMRSIAAMPSSLSSPLRGRRVPEDGRGCNRTYTVAIQVLAR